MKKNILISAAVFFMLFVVFSACNNTENKNETKTVVKDSAVKANEEELWQVPDTSEIPHDEFGELVKYGRNLILNTAYYIGPEGKAGKYLGNKMNCTNCHLEAGTKPHAFNFFSTHARYPQYRAREDKVLSIQDRINNCIERPHNGKHLPLDSKEMLAMVCYMKWLSKNVPVDGHVKGDASLKLAFPEKPADPKKGEEVYKRECLVCHGADGEGKMRADNVCYEYPPLWGDKSYQAGSSVHRLIKMAPFVYANMPHKIATYDNPKLTIEEAYDVVAFINNDTIHPRPKSIQKVDYPNIKHKPLDYAKGPYSDTYSEYQHKYGPYKEMIEYYEKKGLKPNY